jgi:tetratricopeptide (TPR) repeat protein
MMAGSTLRRTASMATVVLALAMGALAAVRSGSSPPAARSEALAIVLAPQPGDDVLDRQTRGLQERLSTATPDPALLERLGWTFVAKAQASDDPGYFSIALAAAEAMDAAAAGSPAARLLRGHALLSLHRFAEAEPIARRLAVERGAPSDWALLGDVSMERGRLPKAIQAYQRMVDLRPDAAAYARIAHVRQLTGDLDGALAAIDLASRAASPRNRETFAWVWSKRAAYALQAGRLNDALRAADTALAVHPAASGALGVRGRVLLAQGRAGDAVAALEAAAAKSPLPDVLWTLAEALRESGRPDESAAVETRLVASGEGTDPRGLAVFLASRGLDPARALRLARAELAVRRDVYTWAALAWSEAAAGDLAAARRHSVRALAHGTADARLAYQAAVIAARAGAGDDARRLIAEARRSEAVLLPSERAALAVHAAKED